MAAYFFDSSAVVKLYVKEADTALNIAAMAEGLTIDDPNKH